MFPASSIIFSKKQLYQVLMTLTYNPSYSGGKDQKDGGWKPAQANLTQKGLVE
jgi:hypothetical protein